MPKLTKDKLKIRQLECENEQLRKVNKMVTNGLKAADEIRDELKELRDEIKGRSALQQVDLKMINFLRTELAHAQAELNTVPSELLGGE